MERQKRSKYYSLIYSLSFDCIVQACFQHLEGLLLRCGDPNEVSDVLLVTVNQFGLSYSCESPDRL